MGAVYVFSAYTKIYPIEPFEYTFVDLGVANWKVAPFIARLFISLEFFLGALFILNIKIKTASKISIAVLAMFSIYLIGLIFIGNNSNCGCFGNYISMTPIQALVKNLIMIIISIVIFKFYDGFDYWGKSKFIYFFLMLAALISPHILNYVDFNHSEAYLSPKENHFELPLDSLYNNARIKDLPVLDFKPVNTPITTLSKGKHVLAFMSLTCPHCRIAAKKMRLIKERNPNISMYLVLNGDDNKLIPFFEDTKASNIPYCILLGRNFVYLAGVKMPAILMINNGVVENNIDYLNLEQDEIEKWMAK